MVFILSAGSDPISDFNKFSEEQDMMKRTESISLGQGQALKAAKMIEDAKHRGGWVLLQNCHLSISWMPKLEIIVENLTEQLHKDFRLWLTSMPCKQFPVSTLQNSVKMTIEPPSGLKANLLRTYAGIDNKFLNDSKNPDAFKILLFGFAFFHAIVQDRRKFGPIGWNILYEFNNEDLTVCIKQLRIFIDEYDELPYKVLKFMGAEINYGGRVTDSIDFRLIRSIVDGYICPQMFTEGYKMSESGNYYSMKPGDVEDYLAYIRSFPLVPNPEVFGLHENAEITTQQAETRNLLETIVSIQTSSSSTGGKSREDLIEEISTFIEGRTPDLFDEEVIFGNYPPKYEESMNTVLTQEVGRYNKLLEVMKFSLKQIKKALKGFEVMSEELELMGNSLFDNIVNLQRYNTNIINRCQIYGMKKAFYHLNL